MLSNAYFLAKFRFGTAENELAKKLQKFEKNCQFKRNFANFANSAILLIREVENTVDAYTATGDGAVEDVRRILADLRRPMLIRTPRSNGFCFLTSNFSKKRFENHLLKDSTLLVAKSQEI